MKDGFLGKAKHLPVSARACERNNAIAIYGEAHRVDFQHIFKGINHQDGTLHEDCGNHGCRSKKTLLG